VRLKGKLLNWNEDKAFGFIKSNGGGDDVFIHKTAFMNRKRSPQVNDIITFTISQDKQGRYCAKEATFTGEKLKKKQAKGVSRFSIYLSMGFLVGLAATFAIGSLPKNLLLAYLGLSLFTFVIYASDKSKAKRGAWRTPESTLHLLALAGGWPGAAIAQQLLRHKSQKREFRRLFWFTVIINVGALMWLLSAKGAVVMTLIS